MTATVGHSRHDPPAQSGHAVEWPFDPVVPGPWEEMTPEQARRFVQICNLQPPGGIVIPEVEMRIRMVAPRFYPRARLLEGVLRWSPEHVALFRIVLSEQGAAFLTGINPAGARPAGQVPRLDDVDPGVVTDWLRFFCATVRAEQGPFIIVERASGLHFAPDVDPARRMEIAAVVRPVRRLRPVAGGAAARRSAFVRYGSSLFEARFSIMPSGHVTMDHDRLVAEEVFVRPGTYEGVWHIVEAGGRPIGLPGVAR
ncbi:hypothetical protein [Mongoliimonas terrestris]|uniref:hypothetical protein n=1 Tax=Mongoliimonas terrestris TaxID=1709001 RepID=UPI0009497910|nr:hypothetical protein [Mongoliimonas terrestris]